MVGGVFVSLEIEGIDWERERGGVCIRRRTRGGESAVLLTGTTLVATSDLVLLDHEPEDVVGLGGRSRAANHTLNVLQGVMILNAKAGGLLKTNICEDFDWVLLSSNSGRVQWLVVENRDTLELSEQLKALETSSLLNVGGNSAGLSSSTEELGSSRTGVGALGGGKRAQSGGGLDGGAAGGEQRPGDGSDGCFEHCGRRRNRVRTLWTMVRRRASRTSVT